MCGAMVSLTPCIASKVERECDLHEYAEFHGVDDMITTLNGILATSEGFPQIPIPRKDCHKLVLQPKQEVPAVCHTSRAGSRMPCVHVRPEHQHD